MNARPASSARVARALAAVGGCAALVALVTALGCRPAAPPPPPAGTPRLVVLVVVDQLRPDYLERADALLSGGLRRLRDEGLVFTEARHGHAVTDTAPGHAALATGTHPARSGIVGNVWFDRGEDDWVYCVEDDDDRTGSSRVLTSALGDWLRQRYPAARVVAASGKDRGAVLLAGNDGLAVWYETDAGTFDAAGTAPGWLRAFNERGLPPELFAGATWEPLPVDPAAAAAAGFAPFDRGPFDHGLSRLLGGAATTPAGSFWAAVYRSPFVDEHLARVARAAIEAEDLGGDEWPDLLGLSFSALDTVGHEYGPASLEVLDTLLRLDRSLGELFDLLDRRLGRGSWTVALSADHGVADVPEVAAEVAGRGHRWGIPEVSCMRRSGAAVAARYGAGVWLASGYLDRPEIARRGLDLDEVTEAAAVELEGCPGVAAVWTRGRLTGDPPAGADPEMRDLYRAAWHPERSPDLLLQVAAGDVTVSGTNTTHGSPWDYDRHVPLVLAGAGVVPGRVERPVRTVDLAPTLARLLGVDPPAGIDGRVLPEVASAVAPAEAASGRP